MRDFYTSADSESLLALFAFIEGELKAKPRGAKSRDGWAIYFFKAGDEPIRVFVTKKEMSHERLS